MIDAATKLGVGCRALSTDCLQVCLSAFLIPLDSLVNLITGDRVGFVSEGSGEELVDCPPNDNESDMHRNGRDHFVGKMDDLFHGQGQLRVLHDMGGANRSSRLGFKVYQKTARGTLRAVALDDQTSPARSFPRKSLAPTGRCAI